MEEGGGSGGEIRNAAGEKQMVKEVFVWALFP